MTRLLHLLLISVLGLTFVACGGDGEESSSTTPTDETYTTSGSEEAVEDEPPEPDYDDPMK